MGGHTAAAPANKSEVVLFTVVYLMVWTIQDLGSDCHLISSQAGWGLARSSR